MDPKQYLETTPSSRAVRPNLAICDDHQLMVDGLYRLLDPPYSVIANFLSADQLLAALPSLHPRPDCILLDLAMPGTPGGQALPQIRARCPRAKVLILSMFGERSLGSQCLRAGADGFIPKDAGRSELVRAIEAVLEGRTYLSPRIQSDATTPAVPGLECLTPRQIEILRLVARAMTPGQISAVLGVGAPTVSSHLKLIRTRLGLPSQQALLKFVVQVGLHEVPGKRPQRAD